MSYYIWVESVCFVNGVYPSFFSFKELNVKQQQKRKIDEKTELKGRSPKQLTDLWLICSSSVFGKTFYCYQNCHAWLLLSVEYGFTRHLVDHWRLSAIALTTMSFMWLECNEALSSSLWGYLLSFFSVCQRNPCLYESIIRSLLLDRA